MNLLNVIKSKMKRILGGKDINNCFASTFNKVR